MNAERLVELAGSEAILEALPLGVTLVDAPTRRIVYRNLEARRITSRIDIAYDGTDLAAIADFRWPNGTSLRPNELPGEASIERGETIRDMVFSVPCLDGSRLSISLDSAPLRGPEGSVVGAILTFREVNDDGAASARLVQSERKLAATQRRRNFLTFLGDAVRDLDDAARIVEITTRLTGGHLQVERCSYGTVDVDNDSARVYRGYITTGESDVAVYRLSGFGEELLESSKAGETSVIRDSSEDPRTRDLYDERFAPAGFRAAIAVPLIKGGKYVANFIVSQREPREWTVEEVRLVEEVADRSWNAIERVNTQRQVAASEAKYRTLIEELPQLAWTARTDGLRDYLSPQWLAYTGLSIEDGLGDRWLESIHPEDRIATMKSWRRAVAEMEPYEAESRLRRYDGEYEYFHIRAKPVYDAEGVLIMWIGTNHNIHGRLQDQEALRAKALRQQRVAEAFNRIALGQTVEDILRRGTEEAAAALGARAVLARLQYEEGGLANWVGIQEDGSLVQSTVGASPEVEGMVVRIGSGYRSLRINQEDSTFREKLRLLGLGELVADGESTALAAPMQDSEGNPIGTLFYIPQATAKDTAEDGSVLVQFAQMMAATLENIRLNTNLEGRVAERTALLMQKVEELESFSFIVSHDLRAPLRAIVGNARLVLMDEGDRVTPDGKAMLERLAKAALTMSQLVDDLLEYARLGTKQPMVESVDLAQLAETVASDVVDEYPLATIRIDLPEDHRVSCDSRLIGLVLRNLLDNACKYAKTDTSPEIEVGREDDTYFVRDNGIGFDMTYAGKLFQPFSRLHTTGKFSGTGIGLANVRRILERHGGRIWTESAVGVGTTFYFTLGHASVEAAA